MTAEVKDHICRGSYKRCEMYRWHWSKFEIEIPGTHLPVQKSYRSANIMKRESLKLSPVGVYPAL